MGPMGTKRATYFMRWMSMSTAALAATTLIIAAGVVLEPTLGTSCLEPERPLRSSAGFRLIKDRHVHPLAYRALAYPAAESEEPAATQAHGGVASNTDDAEQIATFQGLIVKGQFEQVEPMLEAYLNDHPKSWQALYFLGYVLLGQRRVGDSIKALARSLELNANNAEAHKVLGRALSVVGRYDFAEREFKEALRLSPGSAEIHYNLGRLYAIQDDFHHAKQELETATRLDPMYMEAYNAYGFALEALGNDASAVEAYHNAIRLNEQRQGKFDAPFVNLSGFYNRRGNLALALQYAQQALSLNPRSDLAYFQIAKACRTKEDWRGVVQALEKAIEIKSSSSQYYYVLSFAYRKLGKLEESRQALEKFEELQKKFAELEQQRREARRTESGLELRPLE
jgi:tetratricopeptide (TPR) repeat protein